MCIVGLLFGKFVIWSIRELSICSLLAWLAVGCLAIGCPGWLVGLLTAQEVLLDSQPLSWPLLCSPAGVIPSVISCRDTRSNPVPSAAFQNSMADSMANHHPLNESQAYQASIDLCKSNLYPKRQTHC